MEMQFDSKNISKVVDNKVVKIEATLGGTPQLRVAWELRKRAIHGNPIDYS